MKKLTMISLVTLSIGLSLIIVSAVFSSIVWGAGFNGANLVGPFNSIGYLMAAFSGIVLTATAVTHAAKDGGK